MFPIGFLKKTIKDNKTGAKANFQHYLLIAVIVNFT